MFKRQFQRTRLTIIERICSCPAMVFGVSVMAREISGWPEELGLEKYVEIFATNEIDFEAVVLLDSDDLRDLGLPVMPRWRGSG